MTADDAPADDRPDAASNHADLDAVGSGKVASDDVASDDGVSDDARCMNCGTVLQGRFCSECGQEGSERKLRPLHHLALEVLDELLSLDSRAWRTLKAIPYPGRLTRAYLGGRRAGYVPPLRLFILSGFLLLALMSLGRTAASTGPDSQIGINVDFDSTEQAAVAQRMQEAKADSTTWSTVESAFFQILLEASEKPADEMNRVFFNRLSVLAFLLFPLFALLMKGFYPRRLYAEHLVFALHVHTAGFLLSSGLFILGLGTLPMGPGTEWVRPVLVVGGILLLAVYALRALHRVYPAPVWLTLLKGVLLLFIYLNVFSFVFLAYSFAAMALA